MATSVCYWRFELGRKIYAWLEFYDFSCTAANFILGLGICYHLVNIVVVCVLTTYVVDTLDSPNGGKRPHLLLTAATLNKVHGGLTAIFELILIFVSDSHIGGYKTLVLSSMSYIAGLTMLVFWNKTAYSGRLILNVIAIFCLSIGCGAKETLNKFLSEQLIAKEQNRQSIDEDRVKARTKPWNRVTWMIATVVSIIFFGSFDWSTTFVVAASAMFFSCLVFIFGILFYLRKEATGGKHDLETSTGTVEKTGSFCQAMQECKSESVIRLLLPICGFSIILGIGTATADTFFQEQAEDLKFNITGLLMLKEASGMGFSFLYDFIQSKCRSPDDEIPEIRKILICWIKVWIGMLLMVACLFVGWRVEAYRHTSEYKGKIPHLSLWLSLQFLLFGTVATFAEDGLNNLLEEHLSNPLKKYASSLNGFAIGGLGNFSSIILLQRQRHWFPYDLKSSRLDKYFFFVAIINIINLSTSILWRLCTVKDKFAAVKPLVCPNPPIAEEEATRSFFWSESRYPRHIGPRLIRFGEEFWVGRFHSLPKRRCGGSNRSQEATKSGNGLES